jgi:hypothetical protein
MNDLLLSRYYHIFFPFLEWIIPSAVTLDIGEPEVRRGDLCGMEGIREVVGGCSERRGYPTVMAPGAIISSSSVGGSCP